MNLGSVSDSLFARYSSVQGHHGYPGSTRTALNGFDHLLADPSLGHSTEFPSHPRLRFGRFHRAGHFDGIDYLDVVSLGGNRFAVVVADLSGPGALAAAPGIRAAVRAQAGRHADSGSLLHHLNECCPGTSGEPVFGTGLCAVLDTRRRTVRIATGGHPAPLLVREGTAIGALPVHPSAPLGTPRLIVTSEHELRSGDRLLFYTDGVTSVENRDGARFDLGRLTSALEATRHLPASRAVDSVVNAMDRFAGRGEPDDDQTLLMVDLG